MHRTGVLRFVVSFDVLCLTPGQCETLCCVFLVLLSPALPFEAVTHTLLLLSGCLCSKTDWVQVLANN